MIIATALQSRFLVDSLPKKLIGNFLGSSFILKILLQFFLLASLKCCNNFGEIMSILYLLVGHWLLLL